MFRNIALLALLAAVVIGVTPSSPQAAHFTPLTKVNNLTFSQPTALPGVTQAPGTYMFEAGPANTNSNVVRVSRDRQTVFIGLTIPAVRAPGAHGFVNLGEAARGQAARILAWYPSGSNEATSFSTGVHLRGDADVRRTRRAVHPSVQLRDRPAVKDVYQCAGATSTQLDVGVENRKSNLPTVYSAGEIATRAAAPGAVHHPQRATTDEAPDYNWLFCWFVRFGIDDAVWSPTTFSKTAITCSM